MSAPLLVDAWLTATMRPLALLLTRTTNPAAGPVTTVPTEAEPGSGAGSDGPEAVAAGLEPALDTTGAPAPTVSWPPGANRVASPGRSRWSLINRIAPRPPA